MVYRLILPLMLASLILICGCDEELPVISDLASPSGDITAILREGGSSATNDRLSEVYVIPTDDQDECDFDHRVLFIEGATFPGHYGVKLKWLTARSLEISLVRGELGILRKTLHLTLGNSRKITVTISLKRGPEVKNAEDLEIID